MKIKKGLSGIYFKYKNPEIKKWENRCFEDMETDEQEKILKDRNKEWMIQLCIQLSNTINEIGNQLNKESTSYSDNNKNI